MTSKSKIFWQNILDRSRKHLGSLLFPPRCPVCDIILEPERIEKGIHSNCERTLFPICGAVCMHCGRPLRKNLRKNPYVSNEYLDNSMQEYCQECLKRGYVHSENIIKSGKALYMYRGKIKQTMYRLKYSNKQEYAVFFAKQAIQMYPRFFDVEAIIPVPMYCKKEKLRGYNQAEVLASALADIINVPIDNKVVCRMRNTQPQKELNDIQRKNNLKNAFQKGKSIVKYKKVLIVDDIYTTGATVEAVAEELKCIGIRQVHVLCICIGGEF